MALVIALPALLLVSCRVRRTPLVAAAVEERRTVRGQRSRSTWRRASRCSAGCAPLVRNHMHVRYIVNPIAGFTSAAAVDAGAALSKEQGARADHRRRRARAELRERAEAAAPRPRARRDGAHRPLLAQRLRATTNPELASARRAELSPTSRSCGTATRGVAAVHVLAARQGGVREARSAERENLLDVLQARGPGGPLARQQVRLQGRLRRVPSASDRADLAGATAAAAAVQRRRVPRRGAARRPRRSASPRLPEERRRTRRVRRAAPDGQPRPGLLQALTAGLEALPARVHEHDAAASATRERAGQRLRQHDRRDRPRPRAR